MNKRFLAIIRNEFIHIFRDPRSLMITIAMPLLMIFIYGNAIKLDIKQISLGVSDHNQTSYSRDFIEKFAQSGYFELIARPKNREEIEHLFQKQAIKVAIVIPTDFSESIHTKMKTTIQVLVDGSNSNTANVIVNYIKIILATYSFEMNVHYIQPPLTTEPRIWYNPDLDSANFILPGLVAVILMMISALLTSITIAREKETGTMEQILVSPIQPMEIILGKVLPYVFIAFFDGALVVITAKFGFGISINGSLILLSLLSFIYLYAALSIGVFISTLVKTQQLALMIALLATILPSVLLSGFIFPIRSMPIVLRAISYIIPAKYFLIIIRAIILKGSGFLHLWPQVIFLFLLGSFLLLISTARFKTRLD